MAPKLISQTRTHPLWWCIAMVCSIMAIAVIITGIAVFTMYLIIRPRTPFISVIDAHLHLFQYDASGVLVTQVSIVVRSENDNAKAHASFSDLRLALVFESMEIARLAASGAYDVRKNGTVDFNYLYTSEPISLSPLQMQDVDVFLRQDRVTFVLRGSARARWRVWILGSVRYWCHLNCKLRFHRSDGNYIPRTCTSMSK